MKILYVDMDNVLVDFRSALPHLDEATKEKYKEDIDDVDGLFSLMTPMPFAIESITFLVQHFDTYILSTAPWKNPSAWSDKLLWIQEYLPEIGYKRLILTHHKNLNQGDYLIDDRLRHGVDIFNGEHIHFGHGNFEDWGDVLRYLCAKEEIKLPTDLL